MMASSDSKLLEACLAGDRQAFGQIVERYQCVISAITYSLTGDLALSEDLVQETFIAAWKRLADLRDRSRLRAWLCGIARNLSSSQLRRSSRDLSYRARPLENGPEPIATAPDPVHHAISKEQEALLWRALEEIPATYREPLVLYYREEKSASRVAEALDLSEDTVKQRLSRGRKMLKARVAAFVEETLTRTRPTKALTVAILAALPAAAPQAAAAGVVATAAKGSAAAKTAAATGMAGAVFGPVLGVLGAILGMTAGVVNTRSPRERRFMLKMCGVAIAYVLLFFAVLFPTIWSAKAIIAVSPWLLAGLLVVEWTAYLVGLVFLIVWGNRRQRRIQIEDGTRVDPKEVSRQSGASQGGYAGIFFGSVLGSLCWIVLVSWITRDWWTAGAVLAAGLVISIISTRVCRRAPERYWRVVIAATACVVGVSLLVVNLRWHQWMQDYRQSRFYEPLNDQPLWLINALLVVTFSILLVLFAVKKRKHRAALETQQKERGSGRKRGTHD